MRIAARRDPRLVVRRQARLARAAGFDRVYLILSFDCDTMDDAAVVADVHARLEAMGVRPSYAVPGALLQQAADVYGRLASAGTEFLNHGGVEHTYYDASLGRHASSFFYDTLEPDRVREDVAAGHRIVEEVVGRRPDGWRTPHFGTYGTTVQLRSLHDTLRGLGYRYSSSTLPGVGLRHGPVYRGFGIAELPVTGAPTTPLEILDSWGFFAAPDRQRQPADYVDEAALLAEGLAAEGAGVINVYGDPLHVHDRPEFFEAVGIWASVAEPVSFGELLDRGRV